MTRANHLIGLAAVFTAIALMGCGPRRIPPMTVSELLEDRVMLDGVLMKCDAHPSQSRDDVECQNAHTAIAQLVKDPDPVVEARRTAAFERAREQRRQALDKLREQQEAQAKVDAYSLPGVPVQPGESAAGESAAPTGPPTAGTINP